LTHKERERQAAQVQADLLDIERQEAALVWHGLSQSMPVEFGADCSPQAVLQCRLVTVPAGEPNGSSPEHAGYDLVGGGRWHSCAATESPYHARDLRQRKVGTSTHFNNTVR
jgi:hypothetical protein